METWLSRLAVLGSVGVLSCGQPVAPKTTLLVTVEGAGVIRSSPAGIECPEVCGAKFDVGTAVTLTAEAAAGSVFSGFAGACSGAACTVTLDVDRAVSARFAVETKTFTLALIGDGSGSVSSSVGTLSCPGSCSVTLPRGTVLTVTATAATNSAFVGWSGGSCSGVEPCTVTLDRDTTLQAAFALKHSLVVSRAGAGSGTVSSSPPGIDCGADCVEAWAPGTVVTLTATPAADSVFTGWSGACSGTSACQVTTSAPQLVTATFARLQYAVAVTKTGTGLGTVTSTPTGITCGTECSRAFDVGTTVTLTATAQPGSRFDGWTGACSGTGSCVVSVSAARDVGASFTLERFSVSISRTGTGAGTVASTPTGITCGSDCEGEYDFGTTVTLVATPSAGSTFDGWSVAGCSGTGPCTFVVTGALSVPVGFTLGQHSVTVLRAGTGTGVVSSAPAGIACGTDCTESYPFGTQVTLSAAPSMDSTFAGWSGGCSGLGSCVVDVTQATSVTATFTLSQYLLTVARAGNGVGTVTSTPSGIACGTECSASFGHGATVTLTAAATPGSTFAGWSGACSGVTGPCEVTMTAVASVTAQFNLNQYVVTVSRAGTGAGTVTSSPAGLTCGATCSAPFNHGTTVTLTASAAMGSTFAGWSGACTGTSACVVTPVGATSVTATFTLNQYTLTVTRAGNSAGTVTSSPAGITCGTDCTQVFNHGTSVTLTAAGSSGSYFAGWSGACMGIGTCVVSMNSALTVTATFLPRGWVYSIRDSDDFLQRGDPDTGALTNVGALGATYAFGDCAWHSGTNQLFMVDGRGAKGLYRVNLTTGAATLVGVHNLTDVFALAFNPVAGNLYGIAGGNLYRFNTTTGAPTLIGATGASGTINGLAWDSARSRLVGVTSNLSAADVYAINVTTGAATALATGLPGIDNNGWTYDPVIDRLWARDYGGNLYQYNPSTFARTSFASGIGGGTCMAYVP